MLVPRRRRGREREHLDLVELVHAEDAAGVLAVGAGLAPEVRREARVAAAAARRRRAISPRCSAESGTSLVPTRNSSPSSTSYTWLRSVGKKPASSIVVLAHEHRRDDRREPLGDEPAHHPLHERELDQHRLAHHVREPRAARLGAPARCRRSPSPRRTRAWSSAGRGGVSPTTRTTSPSSSPPSGTDASAGFGTCSASSRSARLGVGELGLLRRELVLQRRPRPRSSRAARRARPCRSPSTPRSGARAAPRPR